MDKLAAMQVFVRVVETGGLSAAGRALGLAPPSVSRRISDLEDLLSVKLLQRTTRKLSLTEAGEIYYERSRDIVRAVDEANLAVTEKRTDPSGTLRIATIDKIDAGDPCLKIRCRAILVIPVKERLDGPGEQVVTNISEDCRVLVESRLHVVAFAGNCAVDIVVDRFCDRIVISQFSRWISHWSCSF